ncbi:MAG: hypothetical protein AAGJ35_06230, partial [Myxococcota bacterium]
GVYESIEENSNTAMQKDLKSVQKLLTSLQKALEEERCYTPVRAYDMAKASKPIKPNHQNQRMIISSETHP